MTPIKEQRLEREDESGTPAKPQRDPQGSRQPAPPPRESPHRRPEIEDDEEEED